MDICKRTKCESCKEEMVHMSSFKILKERVDELNEQIKRNEESFNRLFKKYEKLS